MSSISKRFSSMRSSQNPHVQPPDPNRKPTSSTLSESPVDLPSRKGTGGSALTSGSAALSEDAVPESDPSSTAGILAERLQAWKHAVAYLEEYMEATEKVHRSLAKEYERVLKTISNPLREGSHFDQSLGGVAGFFENMRANTQALINTNTETEKSIKGSVLPILDRLHREIKNKVKELAHGAQRGAKEVDKARNTTQKHIELLGQQTAAFESTGGKLKPDEDPYVVHRGVLHRLNKQVLEENNHRNDLIAVQNNFQSFEAHVINVVQQAMEVFNQFSGGQAEKSRALYADMLGAAQQIPGDFEWKRFVARSGDILIDPNENPRTVDSITFPNMDHGSAKALIEGSLERKSRNKLSFGYQTGYYVVTPSKFLHEFKDSDNLRKDPTPELSIYLPDAVIGAPNGEKFNVKGKDRSKTISSKLSGNTELAFKAHTAADAQRWFDIIRNVVGATGPAEPESPQVGSPPSPPVETEKTDHAIVASPTSTTTTTSSAKAEGHAHKEQEAGITDGDTVSSPTTMSPTAGKETADTVPEHTETPPAAPAATTTAAHDKETLASE